MRFSVGVPLEHRKPRGLVGVVADEPGATSEDSVLRSLDLGMRWAELPVCCRALTAGTSEKEAPSAPLEGRHGGSGRDGTWLLTTEPSMLVATG